MKLVVSIIFMCLAVYQPTTTTANGPPNHHSQPHPSTSAPPYTNILFVQTWPPSYCKIKQNNCDPKLIKPEFYIHGLWPAYSNGDTLLNCEGKLKDIKPVTFRNSIRILENDLVKYWPSVKGKSNNYRFWLHEWVKHGVCSSKNIETPIDYFSKGLAASSLIKLGSALTTAGIVAGKNPYSKDQIEQAVQVALRSKVIIYVTCTSAGNDIYLKEVYLCMDLLAVNFISCPPRTDDGKCGPSSHKTIQLPLH